MDAQRETEPRSFAGRVFVFLAYTDDSGDKKSKFQVVTAVLIEDSHIRYMETLSSALALHALKEKEEAFEEFKGAELFGGYGPFEGVSREARDQVITVFLDTFKQRQIPIVYGAVDKEKFARNPYGSADPIDVCFRLCLQGVEEVMRKRFDKDLALIIMDDFETNNSSKKVYRQSFRTLRRKLNGFIFTPAQMWHLHDEMYFGNSKDCVGIQLADLCGYFIRRNLEETNPVIEAFYKRFEECIAYQKAEP